MQDCPFGINIKTMADFMSAFEINQECEFYPMFRHGQEMGIDISELMEGKVVAVRFTEAKVFYDIYNNYWGKIFDNVTSEKVFTLKLFNITEPQIETVKITPTTI